MLKTCETALVDTSRLKCNREKPCQNCIARNQQDACYFRGHKNAVVPAIRRKEDSTATRQRIEQLERLVKQLVSERASVETDDSQRNGDTSRSVGGDVQKTPPGARASDSNGKLIVDGTHSVFHGGNDWQLVLEEVIDMPDSNPHYLSDWRQIGHIKETLGQEQGQQAGYCFHHAPPSSLDGSSLLFTEVAPIERLEILSTLPPRTETDRLITWFFDWQNFPVSVPRT